MNTFENLNLSKSLQKAIIDFGFTTPTPIQAKAFSVIRSGKDMVGIAQTGTGKTFAYMLPILQDLKFSKQSNPRVLILVPTRELVLQLVEQINSLASYSNIRALGVYGGVNINTQRLAVAQGMDILVATPGRLYDLVISRNISLKGISKLVIDEVDVMLDLGFRPQIINIFELLPQRRQNIMFSATMTDEVDALIDDFFIVPTKISIAVSGTPLDNIAQSCYQVKNFYTKVNLLKFLLKDKNEFSKVLVFVSHKKGADRLFEALDEDYGRETSIIHSNKSQNYRIRSIKEFDEAKHRILVATDVMARGLDLNKITHVINFDTPNFAENYMHRIGRTGRAEQEGKSILFYTHAELEAKIAIERLMDYEIPMLEFPFEVEISEQLIPDERPKNAEQYNRNTKIEVKNAGFHEKKDKNKKTNQGGSYLRKMKIYKKPKSKGDKNFNRRNKKK
ncbi:MAG: DEAD/DEAH box helicase [Bacteroidales bacterium]|nr:DEAD/DEAH box helicase [Bacteroidales bacterium]